MKVVRLVVKKQEVEKIDPKAIQQNYLDRIEQELSENGVVFFDEEQLRISSEYLILPKSITDVPSKELGEYLNAFTQQKMYHRTLLGRLDLCTEEAKRKYYALSMPIYRKCSEDKLSETAKDRIVNADETVIEAYEEYTDYKKKYSILEISISNIEDAIFMISREVTRRTGDFNEENRNHNVGRK